MRTPLQLTVSLLSPCWSDKTKYNYSKYVLYVQTLADIIEYEDCVFQIVINYHFKFNFDSGLNWLLKQYQKEYWSQSFYLVKLEEIWRVVCVPPKVLVTTWCDRFKGIKRLSVSRKWTNFVKMLHWKLSSRGQNRKKLWWKHCFLSVNNNGKWHFWSRLKVLHISNSRRKALQ